MGLYESLAIRSAPAINELAGRVQDYYAKQKKQEQLNKLRDYLYPEQTTVKMGDAATIPIEGQKPAVMPRYQGMETTRAARAINPEDAFSMGDILDMDPSQALSMSLNLQQQQRPQFKAVPAGETPGVLDPRNGQWTATGAPNETPAQRALRVLHEKQAENYGKPNAFQQWQMTDKFKADQQREADRLKTGGDRTQAAQNYNDRRLTEQTRHNKAIEAHNRITGDIFEYDDNGDVSGISANAGQAAINAARRSVNDNMARERKAMTDAKQSKRVYKDPNIQKDYDDEIAIHQNNIDIYQSQFNALNTRKVVKKPPPTVKAGTFSPADQQALDWAKQNPDDPRATAILKLHGQ